MLGLESISKYLILTGIILIVVGALFFVFAKVPWFGRLPGDIVIQNENSTIYFPIATMILVSIGLTLILNLIGRR